MHTLPVLALIAALTAKALLRAHHGPPRQPWERGLTAVAAALTLVALVMFVVDVQGLAR
jgi:hypothetical protein